MSEFVVWFDSSETGAPVLNNTVGSLIGVLDACLVTGFNTKSVTSVTVAAGVATVICNGHGFSGVEGKDVLIGGATPADLNGRKQITAVDSNTFRFATAAAPGNATGTITAKRDSLGWIKQFSGVNKAVYKRTNPAATSMVLRIDDAYPTDARAIMAESATGVDQLIAVSPSTLQLADGCIWSKGAATSAAKSWKLIGDGRLFYFTVLSTSSLGLAASFGDFKSLKAGDAYNCLLTGYPGNVFGASTSVTPIAQYGGFTAGLSNISVSRPFSQTGGSTLCNFSAYGSITSGANSVSLPTFPSPVDSGLLLNPLVVVTEGDTSGNFFGRGFMAGLIQVISRVPMSDMVIFDPITFLPGRKLIMLSVGSANVDGRLAFDLTGPWF